MQVSIPASLSRILMCVIPVMFLAGCIGEGDGPKRIPGTPAPPPPPDGFCDVINFEVECEPFEFTNFAGGATVIIDNPDKSGLNTTDRVARMQKFNPGNGETFGGSVLALDGRPVDFSAGEAFTMKVWASRSVPVLFKWEALNQERSVNHSGSGEWEELCFDFTGSTTGPAPSGLTFIFDLGVTGNAATDPANWTFFFDEITQVASCDDGGNGGGGPVNLPVNFESTPASYDFGPESGFDGGVATIIANPDRSGLNTTAQTARMQKFAGEVFGGATLALSDLINFGSGEAFTMKVWSTRQVPVLFKLEDAVSGLPELGKESTVDHSGSGSWEELCFDFSGDLAGFSSSSITFIFDLGTVGDAANNPGQWTFYFDEITQVANCSGGGANPGIIPDAVVYTSDPNVTVDLPPPAVDDLGSGSTFDFAFAGDADFNPALRVTSGGDAGGGVVEGNIIVNGGFETGTFDGWQRFPNNGVLTIVTDNPSAGTFAANLLVPVRGPGDPAADPLIKNANLQAGNLTPGATVTVSFDMRGTLSGAGGVVFAELFSELAGEGVSKAEILSGGPLAPTADWTTYSFTTTLGPDVSGGVTLQLKASCGPVVDCGVDVVVDNVSLVVGAGSGSGGDVILADNHLGANIGVIALTGYAPGFAAGFETFNFKVKGLPGNTIEVRFIEGGDTSRVYDVTTYAGSTALGNGWYQLSIPLTDFSATIASNQGFALGPLGEQAAPFSFLLTDIGFSGTAGGGGGAGPGIIPDAVVFATDPGVTVDLPPPLIDNFGSGSTFNFAFTGDADFNPALQVTSGEEYGAGVHVGFIALFGYPSGFAAGFETFNFKVKGLPEGTIEVKFIGGGDTSIVYDVTTYAGSTALGNGWYQLSIPLTDFAATIASNDGFLLGPLGEQAGPFSFLLTDIGFSGTAGGGGSGDNIVVNGGFETGTFQGWETFPGGGIQAIVTDNPSSGTYAANLVVPVRGSTDAGVDNLIKNSNLEAGNLTPGAAVTVSFDMRGSLSGAGGVVFAELFSELSGGGTSRAEILGGVPLVPTVGWTTYSFPTTLGADVSGGVTLQLKTSCGPVEGCGVDVFFDNVSISIGGDVEPPPPGDGVAIDFDGAGPFNFVDFEGGVATVVANPDQSGLNTSAQVARMQKFLGAPFGGSTLPLAGAVDFSAGTAFTMKVWSARPVPVTFKLEGLDVERVANHSGGSAWQELCFDFTGSTTGTPANGITFIFDNGTVGDAQNDPDNWTFYFDGIEQVSGCTGEPPPPVASFPTITFDDPAVTYTVTGFGGSVAVLTNDPAGGSNMVAQVLKPNTAQVWAGTTVSTLANFAVPVIPFTVSETRMTVRVYSPDAGIPVMLRVEDAANNTLFVEALANTTVANAWETLTFDFASPRPGSPPLNLANTYNKVSIYFNFGFTGAGEKIYFLDDIAFGGEVAGNIAVNGGFETGTFEGWETFPGGGIQAIVTDNPSSGTYAANLVVPVRTQADPAVDNLIKNSNLEAGNLTPGAPVTVSFDLRGTLSGAGGVVFAELFSELTGGGTSRAEILGGAPLVPTAEWASCSFNTILGPDVSGGVTLQLKTSCGPVEGCGVDAYFDNVSIVVGATGDGGGCTGGGGGGGGVGGGGIWDGGGIAVNGGFETGTFDGWETIPGGGIQSIVTDNPSSGTYAANLVVPVRTQADPAVDNLIKNSNLEAGNLTPGASVTVSFDLRGSLSGAGGVVFAEFFSELAGGGTSRAEILGGGPLTPTTEWRKYSFDTTLGSDVNGGVTLQLKTSCGPVEGCGVDAYFDNVSIVIN